MDVNTNIIQDTFTKQFIKIWGCTLEVTLDVEEEENEKMCVLYVKSKSKRRGNIHKISVKPKRVEVSGLLHCPTLPSVFALENNNIQGPESYPVNLYEDQKDPNKITGRKTTSTQDIKQDLLLRFKN